MPDDLARIVTIAGAAALGAAAYLFYRRTSKPKVGNPPEFVLERFFAEYEFNAKYQICNSDVSALSLKELLAVCKHDTASLKLWEDLSLSYTESRGLPELLEEIASCFHGVEADDVIEVVPAEGILLSANALVQQGDHVICVWPAYQSLFEIARARGATVHKWRARGGNESRLHFDVDDLQKAVDKAGGKVKLITINFPHNPTGCMLTADEQARVIEIAKSCGAFLLSDEMYRGLEYDEEGGNTSTSSPRGRQLPAMCEIYEKGITLGGMSKVYALPGLRVGWLISNKANGFIDTVAGLKDYTTICGSAPSEVLALMALRSRDALLKRSKKIVADGLKAVDAFFAKHDELAYYHRPDAGPICYPCFKGEGLSATDVLAYCRELVAEYGVLILPGGVCYEEGGEGGAHFRIGLGRLNIPDNLQVYEKALKDPSFATCRVPKG